MKTFHIYTDASCKNTKLIDPIRGVSRTTEVGVIVVNSNILDIFYTRKEKFVHSNVAERYTILDSVNYVKSKYKAKNIIVHTDSLDLLYVLKEFSRKNNIEIRYVKGHCTYRKGLKYKFNCLADWISKNGIDTWRNYYYRHLL